MNTYARRRSFAQTTVTVGAGATLALPSVPVPSPPFLDESSTPARFRKVLLVAAGTPGPLTAVANWTITANVSIQPMKAGPVAAFVLPAAAVTNLALLFEITAPPGAALNLSLTNAAGVADTCTISYGALVAPSWTDPDKSGAY